MDISQKKLHLYSTSARWLGEAETKNKNQEGAKKDASANNDEKENIVIYDTKEVQIKLPKNIRC